jgi:tryptophanyl-tRNA synthetase
MRERYAELMSRPERIEDILQAGAAKAKLLSEPFMARLRDAVGLRATATPAQALTATVAKKTAGKRARFVSFRDEGGQFRFRLLAADGQELLLSEPFDNPKAAGAAIQALQSSPLDDLATEEAGMVTVYVEGRAVSRFESARLGLMKDAIEAVSQG